MRLKDATILIADDEIGLLKIFKRWFEREGCGVLTAENGEQALELVRANPVDLLISDIRMPIMDGIELARKVRESSRYLPKIIFVSGFHDLDDRDCFDLGVEAQLSKPIERQAIVSAARRSLMERDELWSEAPVIVPARTLEATFESLAAATQQGLIAFGRGGFCISSDLIAKTGETLKLAIEFARDRQTLLGQGILRWIDAQEEQLGIEISHVEDEHRSWVANAARRSDTAAFIPRSSAARMKIP